MGQWEAFRKWARVAFYSPCFPQMDHQPSTIFRFKVLVQGPGGRGRQVRATLTRGRATVGRVKREGARVLTASEIDVLLDQVGRGSRDAFRFIVRAFSLPLRCYIASQVHHPNDVDDLTQEVFLAAYRQLADVPPGRRLRGLAPGDRPEQAATTTSVARPGGTRPWSGSARRSPAPSSDDLEQAVVGRHLGVDRGAAAAASPGSPRSCGGSSAPGSTATSRPTWPRKSLTTVGRDL